MTTITANDLVFYKNENGDIQSGGYLIETLLKSTEQTGGGSNDSTFNDLCIPAGLLYMQSNPLQFMSHKQDEGVIDDSLFDKLFNMISVSSTFTKTHRQKTNNRKTRKFSGKSVFRTLH